ncbi:DNRLRE domain-containing protein [Candidatus Altiarchaeota archaeon]
MVNAATSVDNCDTGTEAGHYSTVYNSVDGTCTITYQPDSGYGNDNTIRNLATYEEYNYGGSPTLGIGETPNVDDIQRSLIYFNLSVIPSGLPIQDSVELRLFLYAYNPPAGNPTDLQVRRITFPSVWGEGTSSGAKENGASCWDFRKYATLLWLNGAGAADDTEPDPPTGVYTVNNGDVNSWINTSLNRDNIQEMVDGGWFNLGFLLKAKDETDRLLRFHSSEYTLSDDTPMLVVTYTPSIFRDDVNDSTGNGICDPNIGDEDIWHSPCIGGDDPTDLAVCDESDDCVYEGICYDFSMTVELSTAPGRTGAICGPNNEWADCDWGPIVCNGSGNCNLNWTLCGEITNGLCIPYGLGEYQDETTPECCGDDVSENFMFFDDTVGNPTCDNIKQEECVGGDNTSDNACCIDADKCVYQGKCYDETRVVNISRPDAAGAGCLAGEWIDCDGDKTGCQSPFLCSHNWTDSGETSFPHGEYENDADAECCGDDSNEYFIDNTSIGRGVACCNNPGDTVAVDGKCYTGGQVDCAPQTNPDCGPLADIFPGNCTCGVWGLTLGNSPSQCWDNVSAGGCCGDDDQENNRNCSDPGFHPLGAIPDLTMGWPVPFACEPTVEACCDDEDDCVNATYGCMDSGIAHTMQTSSVIPDRIAICNNNDSLPGYEAGDWIDCDFGPILCRDICGLEWNDTGEGGLIFGEYDDPATRPAECCGDDDGEYIIDNRSVSGGGAACCDQFNDSVYSDGTCTDNWQPCYPSEYCTFNADFDNETCINDCGGSWWEFFGHGNHGNAGGVCWQNMCCGDDLYEFVENMTCYWYDACGSDPNEICCNDSMSCNFFKDCFPGYDDDPDSYINEEEGDGMMRCYNSTWYDCDHNNVSCNLCRKASLQVGGPLWNDTNSFCDGNTTPCWIPEGEIAAFGEYGNDDFDQEHFEHIPVNVLEDNDPNFDDMGPGNISIGNLTECCGDDVGEYFNFLNDVNDSDEDGTCDPGGLDPDVDNEPCVGGSDTSDLACCDNENDCVLNGTCYDALTMLDVDEDGVVGEICNLTSGIWRDCDMDNLTCTNQFGCNFTWRYAVGGESGVEFGEYENGVGEPGGECCGDDEDEYYSNPKLIYNETMNGSACHPSMDSFGNTFCEDTDDFFPGLKGCCSDSFRCFDPDSGECVGVNDTRDIDVNGDDDICVDFIGDAEWGVWVDCTSSAHCLQLHICYEYNCTPALGWLDAANDSGGNSNQNDSGLPGPTDDFSGGLNYWLMRDCRCPGCTINTTTNECVIPLVWYLEEPEIGGAVVEINTIEVVTGGGTYLQSVPYGNIWQNNEIHNITAGAGGTVYCLEDLPGPPGTSSCVGPPPVAGIQAGNCGVITYGGQSSDSARDDALHRLWMNVTQMCTSQLPNCPGACENLTFDVESRVMAPSLWGPVPIKGVFWID